MPYARISVQVTTEELAVLDRATAVLAAREPGRRSVRSDVIRTGALRYAEELLQKEGSK